MADTANQNSSNGNEDITFVYRPMELAEGVTYKLISDLDMTIVSGKEIKVPANTVTIFTPTAEDFDTEDSDAEDFGAHVKINEHLGKDFVTGWNKLPNEIHLDIIKYLVLVDEPISHPFYFPKDHPLSLARRSIPKIAQNVEAEYYKHNTFKLYRLESYFPTAARPLVRTLVFDSLFFPKDIFWSFVQRIANGTTGFTNLKFVTLKIALKDTNIDGNYWKPAEPVVLNCKGKIMAISRASWGRKKYQELQQMVSGWVVFKP